MDNDSTPYAYAVPVPPPTAQGYGTAPPSRESAMKASHQQSSKSFRIPSAEPASLQSTLDDYQTSQLMQQGYSRGLAQAVGESNVTFPLRFWVVDNSGSMAATDGNRLIASKKSKNVTMAPCTRWKEIQETVDYHAQMAALLKSPTVFRLLNNPGARVGPQEFSIAQNGTDDDTVRNDLQVAKQIMERASPTGVTPLTRHVYEIKNEIILIAPQMQREGRKVVIVLATDGLPSNDFGVSGKEARDEFITAMRSLEGLPIWIVIRLCTNDDDVVEFYNNIDSQLELSIEVLDDFTGEAEEVYEHNPWINYALPLHRIRENGFQNRLFDLLDERRLTKGELREFCILLFGLDKLDGIPEPEVDFKDFLKGIDKVMRQEKKQWNPVKKKMMQWLDLEKMSRMYGDGGCSIM